MTSSKATSNATNTCFDDVTPTLQQPALSTPPGCHPTLRAREPLAPALTRCFPPRGDAGPVLSASITHPSSVTAPPTTISPSLPWIRGAPLPRMRSPVIHADRPGVAGPRIGAERIVVRAPAARVRGF
ncbi:hypothetical protein OJAV_G00168560 [Oryzias javanicus]|uniref:Uncharacterized protein n=1 Tax=Oryzias javanicus TaxID=123683 RepID=A0A437CF79_ORYJA|nr:hypothetical protein OJAV_G00168560 [Oryzias javanicus]